MRNAVAYRVSRDYNCNGVTAFNLGGYVLQAWEIIGESEAK